VGHVEECAGSRRRVQRNGGGEVVMCLCMSMTEAAVVEEAKKEKLCILCHFI
jgi:hypothetical protein